ncbi:hypothetical protein CKAH01_07912 [Colletotrichum kahawae]|uniref:Uncharacterized protein n=1 Tax=Colletotrichum kahawae TaxID=34407 RepID=A0AAD9Y4K0_COLKA|nr:hypothetical protein CKAH01_07912 [Colletotrichum kahawae]
MRLVRVVCCALPAVSPSIISGRKTPIHSPSEQSQSGRSQTPETEAHSFTALHCLCIHSKFRLFIFLPVLSTFSWAASCDEVQEEGHFGVAERRFILSGYRGTKSQKVAADAGVQASRKTHRPRFIQMHSCLGYHMQRQARGTLTISVKRTHTMGRRMNNGPADERRERTRACACLSSSICRRVAQQDTGSKAESRFHRLRRFCTIEARFSLSLCWRSQFLPTATVHHHDGSIRRLYRSPIGAPVYGTVVGSRLAAGRSGVCASKNDSPHEGDHEHAMRRSLQPAASPKPRNMDMNQAQSSQLDRMPPFIKPSDGRVEDLIRDPCFVLLREHPIVADVGQQDG